MNYQLTIELSSYWHAGAGSGTGVLVGASVVRDHYQLPVIPGRTLKGLCRDAVWCAETWAQIPQGCCETLFGTSTHNEDEDDPNNVHPSDTQPGILAFDNGALPAALQSWLRARQQAAARDALFAELHATALNEHGVAKSGSLRGMEVAVPLTLHAPLTLLKPSQADLLDHLRTALPLVRNLGVRRNRGLGRARFTLEARP